MSPSYNSSRFWPFSLIQCLSCCAIALLMILAGSFQEGLRRGDHRFLETLLVFNGSIASTEHLSCKRSFKQLLASKVCVVAQDLAVTLVLMLGVQWPSLQPSQVSKLLLCVARGPQLSTCLVQNFVWDRVCVVNVTWLISLVALVRHISTLSNSTLT